MPTPTGRQKAAATAKRIKDEVETKKGDGEKKMVAVKNELEAIQNNSELASMYKDNAEVGAGNIASTGPLLKVHSTGRSENELADGSDPADGYFFYAPTQEQFKTVTCHILTISRGFRAPGYKDERKDVFNQIMAGLIIDGEKLKPFLIYLTGIKLQPMWDFGKEASKYTKATPIPIPMFTLSVKFTTRKVAHDYGKSWAIDFEILKNKDGTPKLVTDPGKFVFLKDNVDSLETMIESFIANKETVKSSDGSVGEAPHPADEVMGD